MHIAESEGTLMAMNRRDFNKTVLGGVAGALLMHARGARAQTRTSPNRSLNNRVQFGPQPFGDHNLPRIRENLGELIRRLVRNGMGSVELHATWVEPDLDGISASAARDKLREWRLKPPGGYYQSVRKE